MDGRIDRWMEGWMEGEDGQRECEKKKQKKSREYSVEMRVKRKVDKGGGKEVRRDDKDSTSDRSSLLALFYSDVISVQCPHPKWNPISVIVHYFCSGQT